MATSTETTQDTNIPKKISTGVKEYETSLRIGLSESTYVEMYNTKVDPDNKKETRIMYFTNGIRKNGEERMQFKHVNNKRYMMKIVYYNDKCYFIPYVRKECIEFDSAMPEKIDAVETIIIRNVIYENVIMKDCKVRIAIERTATNGLVYNLTAEVEYGQLQFKYFHKNVEVEDRFFQILVEECYVVFRNMKYNSLFKKAELPQLNIIASRVFKNLYKDYNPTGSEIVVHKYDGHKARVVMSDNRLFYSDALNNIHDGYCEALKDYKNIFFQLEVLDNNYMCIVDILGGYTSTRSKKEQQHMPKPIDAFKFFKWMRKDLEKKGIVEPYNLQIYDNNGKVETEFKVFTQKPIDLNNNIKTPHATDGFIIAESDKLFKYKVPTIDIVFINGFMHISGFQQAICTKYYKDYDFDKNHKDKDKIYEVQQNIDGETYIVLRQRADRHVPSTFEQLTHFRYELLLLRRCIKPDRDLIVKFETMKNALVGKKSEEREESGDRKRKLEEQEESGDRKRTKN